MKGVRKWTKRGGHLFLNRHPRHVYQQSKSPWSEACHEDQLCLSLPCHVLGGSLCCSGFCTIHVATRSKEVAGHRGNAARTVVAAALAQAVLRKCVLRSLTCFLFTSQGRSELCPAYGLGRQNHLCQLSPPPRSDLWSKANLLVGTL